MTHRPIAIRMRQTGALALAILLVAAMPVAAEPTTSTVDPAPVTTPDTTPNTTPDTTPDTTTDTPPRTAPSAEETSPIPIAVDPETERFRRELAARQSELDVLTAKLDELDRELALAAEAYNAASERLAATRQQMGEIQVDLEKARQAYEFQIDLLNSRANAIYRDGAMADIEVLLDSKSLTDFVARVKFLNTIGLADAEVAEALGAQKDLVEQAVAGLEDAETQAAALEFELRARQVEVTIRIQERQDMLASAQAGLLDLLDEEASRRQSEEATLLRQILSGAGAAGIVAVPGSPVETALAYHGIPYLWGGETPSGFDCSGLVMYVYRQHGVVLPHYSGSQFLLGEKILPADLQPGDVVFFGSPIHHVGIYMGGDYFLHAPRTGDFVKISKLSSRRDYAGARRYDWVPRQGAPAGVSASLVDPLGALGQ